MSGNMALLGIDAANGRFPLGYLVSLGGFTLGAATAWRWMRAAGGPPLQLLVRGLGVQIATMVALAIVLGAADVSDDDALRMAVIFALAAAMGLQTALARKVGVEDVNTTVATMTLHAYAADSRLAGGDGRRWRRRSASSRRCSPALRSPCWRRRRCRGADGPRRRDRRRRRARNARDAPPDALDRPLTTDPPNEGDPR